jgi:hypothetical protein
VRCGVFCVTTLHPSKWMQYMVWPVAGDALRLHDSEREWQHHEPGVAT